MIVLTGLDTSIQNKGCISYYEKNSEYSLISLDKESRQAAKAMPVQINPPGDPGRI